MIRSQYMLLAEYMRPGQQNTMDLLGIFDRIFAPTLPAQHRDMAVVVLLVTDEEADLGKKPFVLSFHDPAGNKIWEQQGIVDMRPVGGTWLASGRLVFRIVGLPVRNYGRHRFRLLVSGTEVANHPLTVTRPDGT